MTGRSLRDQGDALDWITDWRTLERGQRVQMRDELGRVTTGSVHRIEPCKAPDSAWAYIAVGGSRGDLWNGADKAFLLVDGLSPRLAHVEADE